MKAPTPQQIREARESAGLSCRALSRLVPWSERTQIRYEQGDSKMLPDRWAWYRDFCKTHGEHQ